MSIDDISAAIKEVEEENVNRVQNENVNYFLRSVFAISRALPFSDESAKENQQILFSMCTKFNLPTLMFTITPEDSYNF
jgi:hypothetical protein